MKILHVYSGIYTGGGIIKKIINLVTTDRKNTHELYFIWYSDPLNKRLQMMKYLKSQNIDFNFTYHKSIWTSVPDFYNYLKNNQYDAVHFYTDNVMVIGKIVKLMGIKHHYVRSFEGAPMYVKFPHKYLINWALTSCKDFVSISKYVENSYSVAYSSLKNKNKTVVYNAMVHNLQKHNDVLERDGIICVGTLTNQKQFDVAIHIVSILKNRYKKEISLYILGEGNDKSKLQNLTKDLAVEDLVHFEGVVTNPESYYDKCRLFLHPAYNEGFGLVLIEAMKMELGVLVANSGALPEIVEDGKTGYILPLKQPEVWADKINEIYDDLDLLRQIGKQASLSVEENFSVERHINGYINFYKSSIHK